MDECVFCKIIAGKMPSNKVYEDQNFLAFLDIRPLNKGHTLVIPKTHYRWVWDLPDEELKEYSLVIKKVAEGIKKALKPDFVASIVLGNEVPHAHVWIMPRWHNDGHEGAINFEEVKNISSEEMKQISEKILSKITTETYKSIS